MQTVAGIGVADRAAGALMGAFIGDALALGPHWYYDLEQLRARYGSWIADYTDPCADHYHAGMRAGQSSQSGLLLRLLLESLATRETYDEADFCRRLDEDFFPLLNGEAMAGPGGYTSQSMRTAWRRRVVEGLPWGEVASNADNTEAAERCLALAVRYALQPAQLAQRVSANTLLTQNDGTVLAMTVAFAAVLGMLVEGHALDGELSTKLMDRVQAGILPFHSIAAGKLQPPVAGKALLPAAGNFPSPDALLTPSAIARAAHDPDIRIEPAWKVSLVYGMPCAVYHQFPPAYYLGARFADDFGAAVLHAVNGGGQNMARAMLTGALVGAQLGLQGIPQRFIDGLEDHATLLALVHKVAAQAADHRNH